MNGRYINTINNFSQFITLLIIRRNYPYIHRSKTRYNFLSDCINLFLVDIIFSTSWSRPMDYQRILFRIIRKNNKLIIIKFLITKLNYFRMTTIMFFQQSFRGFGNKKTYRVQEAHIRTVIHLRHFMLFENFLILFLFFSCRHLFKLFAIANNYSILSTGNSQRPRSNIDLRRFIHNNIVKNSIRAESTLWSKCSAEHNWIIFKKFTPPTIQILFFIDSLLFTRIKFSENILIQNRLRKILQVRCSLLIRLHRVFQRPDTISVFSQSIYITVIFKTCYNRSGITFEKLPIRKPLKKTQPKTNKKGKSISRRIILKVWFQLTSNGFYIELIQIISIFNRVVRNP